VVPPHGADEPLTRGLKPRRIHHPLLLRQFFDWGAFNLAGLQAGALDQIRYAHAESGFTNQQRHPGGHVRRCENIEPGRGILRPAIPALTDIHHDTATDRYHRGEHTDDETVARQEERGRAEHQPGIGGRARLKNRAGGSEFRTGRKQPYLGLDLRSTGMEMDGGAVLERLRTGEQFEAAIDVADGLKAAGLGQNIAARDFEGFDIG